VGAAKVTFTLPSYVRFVSGEPGITFNPDSRTVTWAIGDIDPREKASASFQAAITPSDSQRDSAPVIVNDQSFSGVDRFTQQQVSAAAPALTTELPGSPSSGTVK
jgi:hypothetical protein